MVTMSIPTVTKFPDTHLLRHMALMRLPQPAAVHLVAVARKTRF